MMKSLSSAVSGLKAQQTAMNVIGNNIANVNTPGFRSSSTNFEDMFYQTLSAGTTETNPSQVGYGADVQNVSRNMTSGGSTTTDNPDNLYINGDGYFAVSTSATSGEVSYYTRVGNLSWDTNGFLVDGSGNYVMGSFDGGKTLTPIQLTTCNYSIKNTAADGKVTYSTSGLGVSGYQDLRDITFMRDGSISAVLNSQPIVISQSATSSTGAISISGLQVALATFVNENGLSSVGNNYYQQSASSGAAGYCVAGSGNTTTIRSNALESSNVDVGTEFTTMISTQRGFQAASRVITTSDSMLEELVNLKRS